MPNHRLKIVFIFLILTLVFITECQRGRGGGSSGRSSGGSSSGSSGRSSSSYSSSSYSSSSYSSRSPYRNYGYSGTGGTSTSGQAIAIVVGSVCLAFCCFGCVSAVDWRELFDSLRNKDSTKVLEAQFQRIKCQKNQVSTIIMKPKYYEKVKNQFLQTISAQQCIFQYTQDGQSTRIYSTKIREQPEGQFIDRIFLQGRDEVGSWTGKGYFLASVDGPYVWWMKDYNDKQAAGQVGDSQILVYQSTSYYQGRWQGRWYYEGDQNDSIYSGSWSLYDPSNQFAIDPISEASPKKWNPFDILGGRLNPPPL